MLDFHFKLPVPSFVSFYFYNPIFEFSFGTQRKAGSSRHRWMNFHRLYSLFVFHTSFSYISLSATVFFFLSFDLDKHKQRHTPFGKKWALNGWKFSKRIFYQVIEVFIYLNICFFMFILGKSFLLFFFICFSSRREKCSKRRRKDFLELRIAHRLFRSSL